MDRPRQGDWFLQTDPIGSKDDLDLYAYTAGDPINKSDPTGLDRVTITVTTEDDGTHIKIKYVENKDKNTTFKVIVNGTVTDQAKVDGSYFKDIDTYNTINAGVDVVVGAFLAAEGPPVSVDGTPPSFQGRDNDDRSQTSTKGSVFRGGSKSQHDNWYG